MEDQTKVMSEDERNKHVYDGAAVPTDTRELSYGEKAVGISFNPGGNPLVNDLKGRVAAYIDEINALRLRTESAEVKRMCSVAITEAQTSQMWAVKAATWVD